MENRAQQCETNGIKGSALYGDASVLYLVKEGVVPPPDPGPVGLPTHIHFHHRFDVVTGQLTALDDPHTDLEEDITGFSVSVYHKVLLC